MTTKTILIGLDGATFTILDPLMQDGVMPFLKEIVDSGVRAQLRSIIPALTPPAWTSLVTGRSPGHHGIFDFFVKESVDRPYVRFVSSRDVHAETIWSIVNRHGGRVTVLNFPVMFPPPPVDGQVVAGFTPWRQLRLGCHPPALFDRLKRLPGFKQQELAMDTALEQKALEGCRSDEYEDWIELHIRREQRWADVLRTLMTEQPSELTAVLFDGVDKIQHLCWRFVDPFYAGRLSSPWERKVRDRCLEYFRRLDGLLAEIVGLAGPEATVVLASDHGFGPQTGTFFVNAWLEQRGYLAWADRPGSLAVNPGELGIGQVARHVYLIDWERTTAYVPTPGANGVYIVVAGRNGTNGVPPAEYERFREQLMQELVALRDPTSGEPIVSQVRTREDVFAGPYMDLAPDLTLVLRDGGLVSIVAAETAYQARPEPSGTHRPEGIFIARGPGLRRGVELSSLSILDVAPFLVDSLGLPCSEDMEGRVPLDALEPARLRSRPVQIAAPSPSPASPASAQPVGPVLDAEGEAEILRRLQALGYIE
jgi:predicted AlkP superfamily phosphohydrolase/phosphomutase